MGDERLARLDEVPIADLVGEREDLVLNAATCAYVCVSVSRLLANWPLSYPALLPTLPGLEPPRGPSKRLVETLKCNFPPHLLAVSDVC